MFLYINEPSSPLWATKAVSFYFKYKLKYCYLSRTCQNQGILMKQNLLIINYLVYPVGRINYWLAQWLWLDKFIGNQDIYD